MKLNKYIAGALVGINLISTTSVVKASPEFTLEAGCTSTESVDVGTKDVSDVMTVNHHDDMSVSESYLEGKLTSDVKEPFSTVSLEGEVRNLSGSQNRDSHVNGITIYEKGNYSKSRNLMKGVVSLKDFFNTGIGIAHLSEKKKRDYVQTNKIGFSGDASTEENSSALGFLTRFPFHYSDNQGSIDFIADMMWFSPSEEIYTFAFINKTLPGDTNFKRTRTIEPSLLQIMAAIAFSLNKEDANSIQIGPIIRYESRDKKVKEKSTTEKYMPVYENYKDSTWMFSGGLIIKIPKLFDTEIGVRRGHNTSVGTLCSDEDDYEAYSNIKGKISW